MLVLSFAGASDRPSATSIGDCVLTALTCAQSSACVGFSTAGGQLATHLRALPELQQPPEASPQRQPDPLRMHQQRGQRACDAQPFKECRLAQSLRSWLACLAPVHCNTLQADSQCRRLGLRNYYSMANVVSIKVACCTDGMQSPYGMRAHAHHL